MFRKRLAACLAMLGTIALTAFHTSAVPLVDTDSFHAVLTELQDRPLRVDLFDGSLGTLNSVTVTLGAALRSSGTVRNTAAQPQTFIVQTSVFQYAGTRASGSPAALPSLVDVFAPFTVIASETYSGLAPNVLEGFGPGEISAPPITLVNSTAPAVLSQFVGTGQFGQDFDTIIVTAILGGGGNVLTSIQTVADATLTVVYDYTPTPPPAAPVPEPATISLLGLGLTGLAYVRRRRA